MFTCPLPLVPPHWGGTTTRSEIKRINRFSPYAILKAVSASDLVIGGGGSLFQDKTSFRSLLYYASILKLAHLFKKKVVLLGQGVGPLSRSLSQWIVRHVFNTAKSISVRDPLSHDTLLELGVRQPIVSSADLGFNREVISDSVFHPQGKILLALHPRENSSGLSQLIQTALPLEEPPEFIFLECQKGDRKVMVHDGLLPFVKEIWSLNELFSSSNHPSDVEHKRHPQGTVPISCLISTRYHACVWAALHGIPFLTLGEDPKLRSLSESLKQEYISLGDITSASLTLRRVCATLSSYHQNLIETVPYIITQSENNKIALRNVI